jgi:nicotinamidase-related amidase
VTAALLLVDVQKAIDHPSWGERNNPQLEANLALLLAAFRKSGQRIVHVRHASTFADSTYREGTPGFEFKDEVRPLDGEWIVTKQSNSAFIGTALESMLRNAEIAQVVIAGVITNNSVEATARMSGNLGFDTYVVSDGTATFGRSDFAGKWRTADDVHNLSLANLDGEYATVLSTAEAIARFARQ